MEDGRILPGNLKTLERNKKRQKSSTVKLNAQQREIVRRFILAEAERIGQKVEALVVCSNHIHLVARPRSESIEEIAGRYKSVTTRALWRHGPQGCIWTKGYDKRFCFSEADLTQRIPYVNKHNPD